MAHLAVVWGMVVTKMAAAAMRRSDDNVVAKGMCIAARASGNRKWRMGVNNTGYRENAMYSNDGRRANVTTRGA
jgi:hypothetical protein